MDPRPNPRPSSTFEQREDRRWLRWYLRKARPQRQARLRRRSAASGSISQALRPVASAQPQPSDGFKTAWAKTQERFAMCRQNHFNRQNADKAVHTVRCSRDVELEQLIAQQASEMLQQSASGYYHTDSEPIENGLSPQGELVDEQAWHSHALSTDPKTFAEYQDRSRLGFVSW